MEINVEDELKDLEDVTPPTPPIASLEKSSWQNVVSLLETQNALMAHKLESIEPALQSITEAAQSCKASAEKCANKVDEMEALKAALPDDVDTENMDDVIPPVEDDVKPTKKKGLFSKRG